MMRELFDGAGAAHIKREREKARLLRKTRWWRDKIRQGRCHHCGKIFPPKALRMDHLTPLARGGRTGKNNVAPSCQSCNSAKAHKTLVDMKLSAD